MTIDTSREAVERLAKTHNSFEDYPDLYDGGKRPPCKKTAQVLTALLAERDAALAEVASLSTPPDDADAAAIDKILTDWEHQASERDSRDPIRTQIYREAKLIRDAFARLSHALAAETAKREAMEEALTRIAAGEFSGIVLATYPPKDPAQEAARATLAKHGSKT